MFIEKIILSGFRSFDFCEIKNLSPGINTFIGSNGAGKSNIILALDFVLTRNHHLIELSQKNLLISRSLRPQSNISENFPESYVEIHFDNRDEYFPIKDKSIIVKRSITINTDRCWINKRAVKFDEMVEFLESGGLCPDNTYYIVKQGTISEIAASDPKRLLEILRSISGAKSFDEKKIKSINLNIESEQLIKQIENIIAQLKENLALIAIDSRQFNKYQSLSKLKKYLMIKIKNEELRVLREELRNLERSLKFDEEGLQEIEENHRNLTDCLNSKHSQFSTLQSEVMGLQKRYEDSKKSMLLLTKTIDDIRRRKFNQQIKNNFIDLDTSQMNSIEENLESDKVCLDNLNKDLNELLEKKYKIHHEIKSLMAKRQNCFKLKELIGKNLSLHQMNKSIRENHLEPIDSSIETFNKVIEDLQKTLDNVKSERLKIDDSGRSFLQTSETHFNQIENIQQDLSNFFARLKTNELRLHQHLNQSSQLQKELLRDQNHFDEVENWLDLHSSQMAVASKKSIEKAIQYLRSKLSQEKEREKRIGIEHLLQGYHGQLIDLFELNKPVEKAADVLLRNNLFYHVVENESTAIELLKIIDVLKLRGSFKFLILNRAQSKEYQIDDTKKSLYMPLFECINNLRPNSELILSALRITFNGLFIVRSFQACWSLFQNSRNSNFATLEGEMINNAGVVTRASTNQSTRFEKYKRWFELRKSIAGKKQKLETLEEQKEKILIENSNIKRDIVEKEKQLELIQQFFKSLSNNSDPFRNSQRKNLITKHIDSLEADLMRNKTEMSCLIESKDFWQQRIDRTIIEQQNFLEESSRSLELEIDKRSTQLKNTNKIIKIKQDLQEDLRIEINEKESRKMRIKYASSILIEDQISKVGMGNLTRTEIEWNNQIGFYQNQMQQSNEELEKLMPKKCSIETEIKMLNDQYNQIKAKIEIHRKKLENERKLINDIKFKIQSFQIEIENFGFIEGSLFNNFEADYSHLSNLADLNKAVRKLNQQIKRLDPDGLMNAETLRCHQEIQLQIEKLTRAKDRQNDHLAKLRNLLNLIENKRNEIILRTYKQVNANFQETFKKLVPNGSAMLRFLVSDRESDSNSSSMSDRDIIDNRFDGIEILVSFRPEIEPDNDLMALSGGQKALISLAFILALQQVDPMPFYVFDEIDQSLDQSTRNQISEVILCQSFKQKKQFLFTTFREQLIHRSDKIFLVQKSKEFSRVDSITKERAMEFLKTCAEKQ